MKTKFGKSVLFILALLMLQQGIAFSGNYFDQWQKQSDVIQIYDIDPSALFYMESKLALNAEKQMRKKVSEVAAPELSGN